MSKVYCKNCKWLALAKTVCYPSIDDYFSRLHQAQQNPKEFNKNNDCKYYKKNDKPNIIEKKAMEKIVEEFRKVNLEISFIIPIT